MARRGSKSKKRKARKKQLQRETGVMVGYCYFGEPPKPKVLFKLSRVTREQRREITEDWKEDFHKHGMLHLWAGSTLKIYQDQKT